ncbi:MAG: OB-fold nucleic acid binding domain-containing protein [Eubacteriales bacterium]|nr:OB-fold nucleic acid binding domain-containing protein [Eubacteriales bacterium]
MSSQAGISELKKDDRFEGFLLVRSANSRVGSTGSPYLDMMLTDRTGDINAKVWNTAEAAPETGSVVKVRGSVTEFNGRLQLRVEKFRKVQEEDDLDFSLLVPCAPESPDSMYQEIWGTIESFNNLTLKKIVGHIISSLKERLLYYPAAQTLHHAERAGLLHHTTSMLRTAKAVLTVYEFLDKDLLLSGIIVHDIGKVLELDSDNYGNVRDYTKEGLLLGHLVRGVTMIREAAKEQNIDDSDEYTLLLEHMMLSHHGIAEYGSTRPPMFPEAEMLHLIDVMDARMNEMEGIINRTPEGVFSEKIWSLERRIYHPQYRKE